MILSVEALNTLKHGTVLELWRVGSIKPDLIKRPFDPFFYCWEPMENSTPLTRTILKTREQKTIYREDFEDTEELRDARHPPDTFQDNIPYTQLVAANLGFKEASPLPSHAALDIETRKGRLLACGWYEPDYQKIFTGTAKEILKDLNLTMKERNPDILDTYWGAYFDIESLIREAKECGTKLTWGRNGDSPFVIRHEYHRGPKKGVENIVKITGRIHLDVWKEVEMDQTLRGIKNKKLQTVAEWFNLGPRTKYDHADLLQYGMEVVKSECLEDCRKTWMLADHYLKNLYALAEDFLNLPLNLLIERSPSHVPNYIYLREMNAANVVATESNAERFPDFFRTESKAYSGGFCKLYNPGIYSPVKKLDFRSMYPSIMFIFNLDPLTVDFLGVEKCLPPDWLVKFDGDLIYVYDYRMKGIIKCRINVEKEGCTKRWIRNLFKWRMEVRQRMKVEGNTPELESRQWAIKVILNQLYGYHGMKYARLGWAPIAPIVTIIGRWWLMETVKFVAPKVKTIIEVDTDGAYEEPGWTDFKVEDLVVHIKSLIPERYDTSMLQITEESYDAGIFYEEKGYVLKKGEKLNFFGSGLVGRHHPRICDKVLEEVIEHIFAGEQIRDILWKYTKLDQFNLDDFVMTVELRKKPDEYKEKTMYRDLLQQWKAGGKESELGMEISYVRTKEGWKPIGLSGSYDLDYTYYRSRIAESLASILRPVKQLSTSSIEKIIKEGQSLIG
jgi:DNA polymerase elongation subunit (family B)